MNKLKIACTWKASVEYAQSGHKLKFKGECCDTCLHFFCESLFCCGADMYIPPCAIHTKFCEKIFKKGNYKERVEK